MFLSVETIFFQATFINGVNRFCSWNKVELLSGTLGTYRGVGSVEFYIIPRVHSGLI